MKLVKHQLQQQHCSLTDISISTLVQSLTAMSLLHLHNSESKLQPSAGLQHSPDMVGDERRLLLSETIASADPFNMSRDPVQVGLPQIFILLVCGKLCIQDFHFKSTAGTPFGSFSMDDATKFVARAKKSFSVKYANSATSE